MEMKFDPMTGEPIQQGPVQQPQMNFDPMTGQPIQQGPAQPQMNFDPMTGQPIQQGPMQPQMGFDPMTGMPVSGKGRKKIGKWIAAGVTAAVVVLAGGIAFAGVKSGAFLGKSGRVLMAISNTAKDSGVLMDNLEGLSLLEADSYTMDMDFRAGGESIEATLSSTKAGKQLSGSAKLDEIPTIEFLAGIDDEKVKAQIPLLGNEVFVYNYKDEKTGYLADEFGSEGIEAIDEFCEVIYSGREQSEQEKELGKILAKQYKQLEFKAVSAESFKVDGKDRKCKGYGVTITEDFMLDFIDSIEDYTDELSEDVLREMGYSADSMDELRDIFDDMPDVDITFYIYKNMLACVELSSEGDDIQLVFHGGKTRTQNMELIMNRETLAELEGEIDKNTQEYRLYVLGERIGQMQYDAKTGEYELSVEGEFTVDGVMKTDRNGFRFTCRGYGAEASIELNKGAKLQKFDGDEFDIGNASESELEELLYRLYY